MNIQSTIKSLLNAGLTQAEIASVIKRSQPTVCELAAGKYGSSRPSADVVDGLKRLLKKHKLKVPR